MVSHEVRSIGLDLSSASPSPVSHQRFALDSTSCFGVAYEAQLRARRVAEHLHLTDRDTAEKIDVSVIMPCLNEADCLPYCIANARQALELIYRSFGLVGEIVVADNGSSDGSPRIAEEHGARCIYAARRGYGAALAAGARAARGRYLIMGDADGSYDFRDSVAMIESLVQGADFCMGSRFKGTIRSGAMPWKNRYIGNPVLTWLLNLLFRSGISDAHCGLRALTRSTFDDLRLTGTGMEFASEMIIKAALRQAVITEVPASLSRDLRNRPPHLRPWRDGWRHLRYLLMLSPGWVFAVPAAFLTLASVLIFALASFATLTAGFGSSFFGNHWAILAGGMLTVGHTAWLLAAAGYLYGVREGYRCASPKFRPVSRWISLEGMLVVGCSFVAIGFGILLYVWSAWTIHHYHPMPNVLPAILGTSLIVMGMQNILGGFLLSIVSGNDATFMQAPQGPLLPSPTQQAETPCTASATRPND